MAEKEIRHIVRIANTDLQGTKATGVAITRVKGVGKMYASAIMKVLGIDASVPIGELDPKKYDEIDNAISNPVQYGIPAWLLNRRNDPETGVTSHLLTTELQLTRDADIKKLKKIKSYRGYRHAYRLPVRGQKTKSNFRHNKGKVRLGVSKPKTGKKQ